MILLQRLRECLELAERLGEALETLNPYEERFMNETTPTVRRIPHGDNEYVVSYLHEEST